MQPLSTRRSGATINVYLVLRREEEILLLSLRQNTGYCDGYYGLVSGHVEDGESAIGAVIREAEEEAGLSISASELKLIHMMHRKTNRFNIDLFFECLLEYRLECRSWDKNPVNKEPLKCEQLRFYPMNRLPENLIPYIQKALEETYSHRSSYSEEGWQ